MRRLAVIICSLLITLATYAQDASVLLQYVTAESGGPSWSPLSLSPLAWYKADGNATDAQGNYNGTWAGTETYTNGLNGQAFAMTAQNQRISSGVIAAMPTAAGTVCFWVRPNWSETDGLPHYMIDTYGGSNARFYIYEDLGRIFTPHGKFGVVLTRGQWAHVAYVYGVNKLYVNGGEVSDFANAGISAGATTFYIGHRYAGTAQSALSFIDDVMIFTNALTEAQIGQIYAWRQ